MALLRLLRIAFAILAVCAGLGLLVGMPFGHPGGWHWWAGSGAVVGLLVLALCIWGPYRGPNIINGALVCLVLAGVMPHGDARAQEPPGEEAAQPAYFLCRNGQVVQITTLVDRTGVLTLTLPPNVCDVVQPGVPPQPPAPARRAASGARPMI